MIIGIKDRFNDLIDDGWEDDTIKYMYVDKEMNVNPKTGEILK